jgi:hypothetical protein
VVNTPARGAVDLQPPRQVLQVHHLFADPRQLRLDVLGAGPGLKHGQGGAGLTQLLLAADQLQLRLAAAQGAPARLLRLDLRDVGPGRLPPLDSFPVRLLGHGAGRP